jgi:hypothetical protein
VPHADSHFPERLPTLWSCRHEIIAHQVDDYVRCNIAKVQAALCEEGTKLQSRIERMCRKQDGGKLLMSETYQLVTLIMRGLQAVLLDLEPFDLEPFDRICLMQAAINDESLLIDALRDAAVTWPNAVTVPSSLDIVNHSKATFRKQREEYTCRPGLGELTWAKDDVLDNMGDSGLKQMLDHEYSAGAAVKRMIAVLKYSLVTQPLRSFAADDMLNMAAILTAGLVKGISTTELLKSMQVIECLIDEIECLGGLTGRSFAQAIHKTHISSQIDALCTWVALIYQDQFKLVMVEIDNHCQLLTDVPALREHVINSLKVRHELFFKRILEQAKAAMRTMMTEDFTTLDTATVQHIVKLLGCSDLKALVELEQPEPKRGVAPRQPLNRIFTKLAAWISTLTNVAVTEEQLRGESESSLEFLSVILENSPEEWAVGDSTRPKQLAGPEDVMQMQHVLNRASQTLARFMFGLCAEKISKIILTTIVVPAQQMPTVMEIEMEGKVLNPLKEDTQNLRSKLLAPSPEQRKLAVMLKNDVLGWQACSEADFIGVDTKLKLSLQGLLQKLEATIEGMGQACHHDVLSSDENVDSPDVNDDNSTA